jgi:hypothetical protein
LFSYGSEKLVVFNAAASVISIIALYRRTELFLCKQIESVKTRFC